MESSGLWMRVLVSGMCVSVIAAERVCGKIEIL